MCHSSGRKTPNTPVLFDPLTVFSSPQSLSSSSSSTTPTLSPEHFLAPPPMTPPLPPSLLICSPPRQTHAYPSTPSTYAVLQQDDVGACSDTVTHDQPDGVVSSLFIDSVKTASLHLLNIVLYQYLEERCYGCQINHPSQKQHDCIELLPEHFYAVHFEQIMKRLLTDKFIGVVQRFLSFKHLKAGEGRILGVSETVLHELKTVEDVTTKISAMYDSMIGDDVVKIAEIREISDYWRDLYGRKN